MPSKSTVYPLQYGVMEDLKNKSLTVSSGRIHTGFSSTEQDPVYIAHVLGHGPPSLEHEGLIPVGVLGPGSTEKLTPWWYHMFMRPRLHCVRNKWSWWHRNAIQGGTVTRWKGGGRYGLAVGCDTRPGVPTANCTQGFSASLKRNTFLTICWVLGSAVG